MTLSVPYRDTSRTPMAVSLSVLLHGAVVAGLVGFFWFHVPPPLPPPSQTFEFFAQQKSDSNDDAKPGGQTAAGDFTGPTLPDLPPTPVDVKPADTVTVVPVPKPDLVKPAATITPKPASTVGPRPTVATARPSTARPTTAARGATAQKPQVTTVDVSAWIKQHAATGTTPPVSTGARRGPQITAGLNPNAYGTTLGRNGTGVGTGAPRGTSAIVSIGIANDYLAYLRKRLQDAFLAPGGISGQYAVVQLTINRDGEVVVKKIVGSSGNAIFNAAVQAVLDGMTNVDKPPGDQEFSRTVRFLPDGI